MQLKPRQKINYGEASTIYLRLGGQSMETWHEELISFSAMFGFYPDTLVISHRQFTQHIGMVQSLGVLDIPNALFGLPYIIEEN